MNEEIAIKICEQMKDDIDNLCDCCRKDEKNRTCIGCRELAIETILKENQRLKQKYLNAVADYESEKSKNHNAIEHINKFEDIKAYYSYEEDGYEEYNYDEDFKIDLLEILEGGD